MRRFFAGAVLALALVSLPHPGQAQASGVAFAAAAGDVFLDQPNQRVFQGPWHISATGIDIRYWIACINTVDPTQKTNGFAIAAIPNGSTLGDIRTLSTTAVVDACAAGSPSITVPRGAVVLPAIQLGQ